MHKTLIGLALLPVCYASTALFGRILIAIGPSEALWIPLASGIGCWLVVFLILPKPLRLYVLGHELTHVLWAWAMGATVKRIRVSARGGHVVVSKSNFLIDLAPYFFPFYTIVLLLGFAAGDAMWGWSKERIWLHFLLGVSVGFHFTLTACALLIGQRDLEGQGWLLALVTIYCGNILFLLIGVVTLVPHPSFSAALQWWWMEIVNIYGLCWELVTKWFQVCFLNPIRS